MMVSLSSWLLLNKYWKKSFTVLSEGTYRTSRGAVVRTKQKTFKCKEVDDIFQREREFFESNHNVNKYLSTKQIF